MSSADNYNLNCAACGKGGDGLKTCNACKMVKYCNAACQRAHWPKHKKECKKRAAELHDEALFKKPPPRDDCPICRIPLPLNDFETTNYYCCGKTICSGCIYAAVKADDRQLCPFCRASQRTSAKEAIEVIKKRAEDGDDNALNNLGCYYGAGSMGLEQDYNKAMELLMRAGELGCAAAHYCIGQSYLGGESGERDIKKAKHYWELEAIGGDVLSRQNLGTFEAENGNMRRAVKHWTIGAGAGHDESLEKVREFKRIGLATKVEFENALRAHKEAKDEMKSDQREEAAAFFPAHA